ncbi:glutathione S-transferase family protein [Sphingomonas nostoxanthinifaciens]|uniref:glutathione S-transferase family protein n=1 Tax=Sphingomonas nostoxanthinifaciens TaxID=2872652 RepID=UPI001CC20578|nr:glutathione S-transferase family protein [Sphingomonas nostoxanthinifaciens]UAK23996.1 glutathione S-transferase family protein [Sphingomonas nostoxanthinifaciens]
MSDDLILYSNPMSRGRITRWMLEEVGRPYRVEYLDFAALKGADYRALNPMGKVPTLRHGDAVVTEVAAICAYLAAAFPEAGLMPEPGTPASADYHRWLFFVAGPAEAAITAKAFGVLPPADKSKGVGFGTYEEMLDTLETAVTGKTYLAGDRFSAADVAAGSQIGFGLQFGTIEARPAFVDYWAGMTARPAYQRAGALDNAAMPARE